MIPKIFNQTRNHIRDYNNAVEARFGEFDRMTPEEEIFAELLPNPKSGKIWLDEIAETFDQEYKKYNGLNIYFLGCSSGVYESTFLERMTSYLKLNEDSSELTFIYDELKLNYLYNIADYISEPAKKIIERSMHIQRLFLESRLSHIGYKAVYDINYRVKPNSSFVLRFEKLQSESKIVDNAEMFKVTEKVLFLYELGVLDFLRTKSPFNTSINRLADVLHRILEERQTTLQSYLNPMYSDNTYQDNNPLNKRKAVEKVRIALAEIGFVK